MRVPFKYRDRNKAYKNERDRTAISAAIRGSVYRDVPLEGLIATQRHVNDDRVHQYAQGEPEPPSRHSPVVLEHRGRYYLHNGHHRAAAALERGEKTLHARVASLDGPKRFACDAPAGTLLLIDPRAMVAGYMPREEPCVEMVDGGIAVLTIEGPLESKPLVSFFAYYDDYESIMARFQDALASDDVKGVLLKIDSPGGMAAGLNATVDAMRKLKKQAGKPVVAYADEKCCSAAYALACVADEIYLPPAAEIGSVGVTSTIVDATGANEKAGLRVAVITSGKRKADGNPDVELTDEAISHVQARVDHLADLYYRLVEKARGIPVKKVKALEANTFDGENAVDVGLADAVLTLEKTLDVMRAGLDEKSTLDRPTKAMTNNDLAAKVGSKPGSEKSTMTLKLKRKAVAKAERALALAKAELSAAEKTPPAHAASEEDEEEKGKSRTKYVKRTEEIEEEEIGSSDESPASESPPAEEDEEEAGSSAEEEAAEESSAEEAADEEDEAEEAAAASLMALAQKATGKKGSRAIGALAAMLAEGQRAAKKVNQLATERRAEKKALAIAKALTTRRITRHEAKDLRSKSSKFVKSFLSMRKKPLIAIDEEELRTPTHKSGAELPKSVQKQIDQAVAGVPADQQEALRKKLVDAQREQLAGMNGAGRY